jgi:hypothetical protein
MKEKIIIGLFLISVLSFSACKRQYTKVNNGYTPGESNASLVHEDKYVRIVDGFTLNTGEAADGMPLLTFIFFSFECKLEDNGWSELSQTEMARRFIGNAFSEYSSEIFFPFASCRLRNNNCPKKTSARIL